LNIEARTPQQGNGANILQNWSQLVLPVALVFAFGRMVGDWRQGRTLLVTMMVIFVAALMVV
jgi:potassium-transporting ATPase potassium-binding subunit